MGRNIEDIIKSLPADRQAKIADLSDKKVAEMLAHAATLTDFKHACHCCNKHCRGRKACGISSPKSLRKSRSVQNRVQTKPSQTA